MRPARVEDVGGLLAFDMTVVVTTADDWHRAIQLCEEGSRVLHVAVVDGVIAGFARRTASTPMTTAALRATTSRASRCCPPIAGRGWLAS